MAVDLKNRMRSFEHYRNSRLLLAIILVAGAVLRFYNLGGESLWMDEIAYTARYVQESSLYLLFQIPSMDIYPPLYFLLLKGWTVFAGASATGLRSFSAVLDTFSIFLVSVVATRLYDHRTGLFAALLFALSPFYVWYAREARMYALLVFLALLSMYFLIAMMRHYSRRNTAGYLFSTVLLCYAHTFGVLIVAAQAVFATWHRLRRRRQLGDLTIPRLFGLQGVTVAAVTPFFAVLLYNWFIVDAYSGLIAWISAPTPGTLWRIVGSYVGRMVPGTHSSDQWVLWTFDSTGNISFAAEIIVLIALLCFLAAVISGFRRNDVRTSASSSLFSAEMFLLSWLAVPVLAMVLISVIVTPVMVDRYTAAAGIAFIILMARGIRIMAVTRRKSLLAAAFIVLLLAVPLHGLHTDTHKEQWRDVVKGIEQAASEGDIVLVSPDFATSLYEYYRTDDAMEVKGLEQGAGTDVIASTVDGKKTAWLIIRDMSLKDRNALVSGMRELGYRRTCMEWLVGMSVYRFTTIDNVKQKTRIACGIE